MTITRKECMQVSKVAISKWAELICQEIDRDIESANDIYDECYFSALWLKRTDMLFEISDKIKKSDDPEKQWKLIEEVYGKELGLPAPDIKSDISTRLAWLKKQTAQNFEKDIISTINYHNISSPIEQLFLMEWKYGKFDDKLGVRLIPQKHIETERGKYIVDFNILHKDSSEPYINVAIELDGHEFHEKTKQQVAKDKKRDRSLIKSGLTVLRFSGSEIFYSPRSCITEIADYIKKEKAKKT